MLGKGFMAEDNIKDKDSPGILRSMFSRYAHNTKGGLAEVSDIVTGYPKRFAKKGALGKAFSIAKFSALPISYYLMRDQDPLFQSLGFFCVASSFIVNRISHNPYKNSLSVPMFIALAAEHFMMGMDGYGTMVTIAALRNASMATLPDTIKAQKFRGKIGLALAGAATPIMFYNMSEGSAWTAVPLTSMWLATYAASRIDAKSHQSRVATFTANFNNAIYSLAHSGSLSTAVVHIAGSANNVSTAIEKDIDTHDEEGHKLSRGQQAARYFKNLRRAKPETAAEPVI